MLRVALLTAAVFVTVLAVVGALAFSVVVFGELHDGAVL